MVEDTCGEHSLNLNISEIRYQSDLRETSLIFTSRRISNEARLITVFRVDNFGNRDELGQLFEIVFRHVQQILKLANAQNFFNYIDHLN